MYGGTIRLKSVSIRQPAKNGNGKSVGFLKTLTKIWNLFDPPRKCAWQKSPYASLILEIE